MGNDATEHWTRVPGRMRRLGAPRRSSRPPPSLKALQLPCRRELLRRSRDLQLHSDPGGESQSQITEQKAFCGGLNTCPQIPCGLPLNPGGPLWCCVISEIWTEEVTWLCLRTLTLGVSNHLLYTRFFSSFIEIELTYYIV